MEVYYQNAMQFQNKFILKLQYICYTQIFLNHFCLWPAPLVSLPNGRVAADESPGRTDDGRFVRDFKLEPTTREI